MMLTNKAIATILVGVVGLCNVAFVVAQSDVDVLDEFECAFAPNPPVYDTYTRVAGVADVPQYDVLSAADETPSPTYKPTKAPTRAPTWTPTMSPTVSKDLGAPEFPPMTCSETQSASATGTAYVYCEGKSTCFSSVQGAWGWSIDLATLMPGQTLTCKIYVGAGGCNLNKGTYAGNAYITQYSFSWQFFKGVGSSDFHFYSGNCWKNDGGAMALTQSCDADLMTKYDRTPGQYTLISGVSAKGYGCAQITSANYQSEWKKGGSWPASYNPFPLGAGGHRYIAAHAAVASCGASNCWPR